MEKKINGLILYKDWLILFRSDVQPKIGDKIKYLNDDYTFIDEEIRYINNNFIYLYPDNSPPIEYNACYVNVNFPLVEWKNSHKHHTLNTIMHSGYIGKLCICTIIESENNNCTLLDSSDEFNLFKGTLEECKSYTLKLLYESN